MLSAKKACADTYQLLLAMAHCSGRRKNVHHWCTYILKESNYSKCHYI